MGRGLGWGTPRGPFQPPTFCDSVIEMAPAHFSTLLLLKKNPNKSLQILPAPKPTLIPQSRRPEPRVRKPLGGLSTHSKSARSLGPLRNVPTAPLHVPPCRISAPVPRPVQCLMVAQIRSSAFLLTYIFWHLHSFLACFARDAEEPLRSDNIYRHP